MWTILLAGLLFSLADVFYMVWLVDRHSVTQGNRAPVRAAAAANKQPREVLLRGKQRIIDLIERAGIDSSELDDQTIEDLPSWEEVVRLYGPKPIVYGLDRCQQFQDTTQKLGFIGTAGAFVVRRKASYFMQSIAGNLVSSECNTHTHTHAHTHVLSYKHSLSNCITNRNFQLGHQFDVRTFDSKLPYASPNGQVWTKK